MRIDPDAVGIGLAALLPVSVLCYLIRKRFFRIFAIVLLGLTVLEMAFPILPDWTVEIRWSLHWPSTLILGGDEILERHGVWISTIGYIADLILWSVVGAIPLSMGLYSHKGQHNDRILTESNTELSPSRGRAMKKSKSYIVIRRHPYEEPYLIHLEWLVSNGLFSGSLYLFCNVEDIRKIGEALTRFPRRPGDEYIYGYGSEESKSNCYFALRAYTTDKCGHCALQLILDNYLDEPQDGKCQFSIRADTGSIQGLGKMLVRFADLQHLQLEWTPLSGSLHETHKPFDNDE